MENNYIWDEENRYSGQSPRTVRLLWKPFMKDLGNIKVVQIPTLDNGVRKKESNMISAFDSDIGGKLSHGVE